MPASALTSHPAHDARRPLRRFGMTVGNRHFVRHYLEMVAAMFLGMTLLGMPAGWALDALGTSTSELTDNAPALMLLGMMVTMTVPMVGWMRYRGHGRRANTEMAASMLLPTLAAIGLLAAGVLTDFGTLMAVEHVAMLLGMLAAMLLRPDEYAHDRAHSDARPKPATA